MGIDCNVLFVCRERWSKDKWNQLYFYLFVPLRPLHSSTAKRCHSRLLTRECILSAGELTRLTAWSGQHQRGTRLDGGHINLLSNFFLEDTAEKTLRLGYFGRRLLTQTRQFSLQLDVVRAFITQRRRQQLLNTTKYYWDSHSVNTSSHYLYIWKHSPNTARRLLFRHF